MNIGYQHVCSDLNKDIYLSILDSVQSEESVRGYMEWHMEAAGALPDPLAIY